MNQHQSKHMNDAVADFPTMPRAMKGDGRVHFSAHSKVTFVHIPSRDETNNRWYADKDKEHFRQELKNDILEAADLFASPDRGQNIVSNRDLCKCVGIEKYLTLELASHMREKRHRHAHTIIKEIERQRLLNICDDEELAKVSRRSSRWFRERAHILAAGYVDIFSD